MQISSVSSATTATAGSGAVSQVQALAATLADGSGASDLDKISAYTSIMRIRNQSSDTGTGWYYSSTQAERDAVNLVMDTSSMSKRIMAATDDFNRFSMSQPRESNVAAKNIDYFNSLSEIDRSVLIAGAGVPAANAEEFRTFWETQSKGRDEQLAIEKADKDAKATKDAVKVTLSDDAKAALASLQKPGLDNSLAATALQMLQNAAEARTTAKAEDETATEETPSTVKTAPSITPYDVGKKAILTI